MKVIISHVYSADNKGDAALLGVLIEEVRATFEDADMTILTMDKVTHGETFDGVPVRPSFMHYVYKHYSNKLIWLIYGILMMTYTMLWAWVQRLFRLSLPMPRYWKNLVNLYNDADLVIPVGGGYLRTNKHVGSIFDLSMLLHPLVLAKVLGKPTVLYSQSVGPFYRKIESWMFKRVVKSSVDLAIIREDKSVGFLESLGVPNYARSVDAGFLLESKSVTSQKSRLVLPPHRLVLGVTARAWLEGEDQAAYELAMAQTLDYMIKTYQAAVVLIPQVTSQYHSDDDRVVGNAIYELMVEKSQAVLLTDEYDYREIKAIYEQLDLILGTRFHSVIFSLISGVPALAIEYEHKTSGIMHDLGLDEWVVKMEDVRPEILEPILDKLVGERAHYKDHLAKVLPGYIAKAHQAIKFVEDVFRSKQQVTSARKRLSE